jgi:HEPN domain-containing protein
MAANEVAAWLAVVEDDMRQVTNNLYGPAPSLSGAAYHCQQAAEKLVKAVLAGLA